jgi:hypothetical protein
MSFVPAMRGTKDISPPRDTRFASGAGQRRPLGTTAKAPSTPAGGSQPNGYTVLSIKRPKPGDIQRAATLARDAARDFVGSYRTWIEPLIADPTGDVLALTRRARRASPIFRSS